MMAQTTAASDEPKQAVWDAVFRTAWDKEASPSEAWAEADAVVAALPDGDAWNRLYPK